MKVIFIIPPALSHRTSEENLGVGYLTSVLRKNSYNVSIIDAWLENLSFDEIKFRICQELETSEKILMFGISTYVSNLEPTEKIISFIKATIDIPIVAGGFGPSFFIDDFLDRGVDIVSIGEGENTILELCQYFENEQEWSNISGIAYRQNGITIKTQPRELIDNLDSIPFPARDTITFTFSKKSSVNILSSRGCMGHCKFCSVIAFQKLSNGNIWRQRSIKNFVDELEALNKQGVDFIKIIDDSFIEYPRDSNWCKELYNEISSRKIKIRLRGSLVAERITEETVYYLKQSGFFSFACGIENFSDSALKRLGKRASKNDNIKALNILKKFNMYVQCGFILFDPYTTIDELRENLYYMKQYKWILCKGIFSELYAAKGTEFTNELLINSKNGELLSKNENYIYDIRDDTVKKIYLALKEWQKSYDRLYDLIIDPLTAPKNISFESMAELYDIYLKIREDDLDIFEKLLNNKNNDYMEIVQNKINDCKHFREKTLKDGMKIYEKEQLRFESEKNKYLT